MGIDFVVNIIAAGLFSGTPLLIATIGELLTERSGVLNLGVEGMMLVGALTGFVVSFTTGSPWLGLAAAMIAAGMLSLLHGLVAISLRGDQVVSGLALTFVGRGLTAVLGAPYVPVRNVPRLPTVELSFLEPIPILGTLFGSQNVIFYLGILLVPLTWFVIKRTRWGLNLRAIGEYPAAADSAGLGVNRLRYAWVFVGGSLAGMAGAALSLAVTPLWIEDMTAGQGWIAVGLVIFARWDPFRAALGGYIFGALFRMPLDLQAIPWLPFAANPILGVWLRMIPYIFPVVVLAFTATRSTRQRLGAPTALGLPYVRGERGH